jgi:hypothetical protein
MLAERGAAYVDLSISVGDSPHPAKKRVMNLERDADAISAGFLRAVLRKRICGC